MKVRVDILEIEIEGDFPVGSTGGKWLKLVTTTRATKILTIQTVEVARIVPCD